jgi:hypothetical protein
MYFKGHVEKTVIDFVGNIGFEIGGLKSKGTKVFGTRSSLPGPVEWEK